MTHSDPLNPRLDSETELALRLFLTQVLTHYSVSGTYLFSSRARDDFSPDSNADVAILRLGRPGGFLDIKLDLADITFDVLLATGIRIQPLPVWEPEWAHPETYSNPGLLRNMAAEGIAL